jgi:hypothetical protein
VQVVAVIDVGGSDIVLDGGELGVDFCAELGLDGGVAAEKENAPAGVIALVDILVLDASFDLH